MKIPVNQIGHKAISFARFVQRDPIGSIRRLRGYFRDPLFLYQMGKVGSSTHRNTLQTQYHVYHLHTLTDFREKYEGVHKRCPGLESKELDLITIEREPIGRKISTFFQNLVASPYDYCFPAEKDAMEAGVDELLDRFHAWSGGIEEATGWYDKHFEPATGIRLFDHPFDPEVGWSIFRSGRWRVLVLRFSDIGINHVEALNYFVTERFGEAARLEGLRPSNISSRKWYGELMKEFRKKLTFSTDELDRAYDSELVRYFHTEREIDEMRRKWAVR